jgi:hypothetical protein
MSDHKASEAPAAIEGSEILIVGQDIKPAGIPKILKNTNEIVFPLHVKRRGTGTITKENTPKQAKFRKYSILEIGSSISGNILWGFLRNPYLEIVSSEGVRDVHVPILVKN